MLAGCLEVLVGPSGEGVLLYTLPLGILSQLSLRRRHLVLLQADHGAL